MKSYTADDARRRFGEVLKYADDLPLEITRHGRRKRYVLMSMELFRLYEMVRQAHSEQRVLVTTQTAIGKLLDGKDAEGFRVLRIASAMMARFNNATGEKL